nr:hypothetical protein [Gemmatimonadota bacterium]
MMPTPGDRRRGAVNTANATLATTTRFLRGEGRERAADAAIQRATLREKVPVVAVLGESGHGKSTLVKLIAPHDTGDTTDTHLHGLYRVVLPPSQDGVAIARWILPDQDRSPIGDDRPPGAVGAEFTWNTCALSEVILVDTPCTGGLGAAQGTLSLHVALDASVAVFVTDAGAPLTAAELTYLETCANRVDALVVVVTKIDL